ncbi:MAG: hypothetical protein C0481_19535 [Phenylobacterium sp.]|uniref:hypothetical protein n=1 Tax=Phenylobacterium sp. TaxID=1871053 RepID=UPI0025E8BF70|nr:hypothetical protein [Phenylobacterium sp.]MBA4014061.1 hypothetical protein [Phenylobacterium sp.]
MNKTSIVAALAAVLSLGAARAEAAEAKSGMTPFIPPPPAGWSSPTPPNETEDENGMEPSVSIGYGPDKPGERGLLYIILTHPSPHDMPSRFQSPRPLGPSPFAPQLVVSHVKVNELDAYLTYDANEQGGVLQMRVGRVLVGIQGGATTTDQIVAFARSIDTARLQKY